MIHLTDQLLYSREYLPLAIRQGVLGPEPVDVIADSAHVGFVTEGWAFLAFGDERIPLRPGNIVVVPGHTAHVALPVGFARGVALYMRPDFLEAQLRWFQAPNFMMYELARAHASSGRITVLDLGVDGHRALLPRLSILTELYGLPMSEFALLARIADVFHQVTTFRTVHPHVDLRDHATQPIIPRTAVAKAAGALHRNLDYTWSVSEMARIASLSESQLTRLFRQDLGVSPAVYLWGARTDRMAQILAGSEMTIAEAARATGWVNASAAGRAFSRRFGMSPRAFVSEIRELSTGRMPKKSLVAIEGGQSSR